MKKLKKIRICFENTECYEVPANAIESFFFGDIRKSLAYRDDYILEDEISYYTTVILTPDADIKQHDEELTFNGKTLFERIRNFEDIVSFELYYHNNSEPDREIAMRWCEGNDYSNRYQTCDIMDDGSLVVVVDENKTAKEYVEETKKAKQLVLESIKPIKERLEEKQKEACCENCYFSKDEDGLLVCKMDDKVKDNNMYCAYWNSK